MKKSLFDKVDQIIDILKDTKIVFIYEFRKEFNLVNVIISIILLVILIFFISAIVNFVFENSPFSKTYINLVLFLITYTAISLGLEMSDKKSTEIKTLILAPINKVSIILGKSLYFFISIFQAYFFTLLPIFILIKGIDVERFILFVMYLVILVILFMSIGIFIAAFINKRASEIVQRLIFPLYLLFFVFQEKMGNIVLLNQLLPSTLFEKIIVVGWNKEIIIQLLLLLIFVIIISAVSIKIYEFNLRKQY